MTQVNAELPQEKGFQSLKFSHSEPIGDAGPTREGELGQRIPSQRRRLYFLFFSVRVSNDPGAKAASTGQKSCAFLAVL